MTHTKQTLTILFSREHKEQKIILMLIITKRILLLMRLGGKQNNISQILPTKNKIMERNLLLHNRKDNLVTLSLVVLISRI